MYYSLVKKTVEVKIAFSKGSPDIGLVPQVIKGTMGDETADTITLNTIVNETEKTIIINKRYIVYVLEI